MNKQPIEITDATGRKIVIQNMDYLTQTRCAKILGPHSANANYIGLTLPLFYIRSIDGKPVAIKNEVQLENLIERLGTEGATAVTEGVVTNFHKDLQGESP